MLLVVCSDSTCSLLVVCCVMSVMDWLLCDVCCSLPFMFVIVRRWYSWCALFRWLFCVDVGCCGLSVHDCLLCVRRLVTLVSYRRVASCLCVQFFVLYIVCWMLFGLCCFLDVCVLLCVRVLARCVSCVVVCCSL